MIATVSPADSQYHHTVNTLKYADRAKEIKTHIQRNIGTIDTHVSDYQRMIDSLQTEVCRLKKELSEKDSQLNTKPNEQAVDHELSWLNVLSQETSENVQERINLQKALFELEETNLRNRTELQHLDNAISEQQAIENDGAAVPMLSARRQVILDNIRDNDESGANHQKEIKANEERRCQLQQMIDEAISNKGHKTYLRILSQYRILGMANSELQFEMAMRDQIIHNQREAQRNLWNLLVGFGLDEKQILEFAAKQGITIEDWTAGLSNRKQSLNLGYERCTGQFYANSSCIFQQNHDFATSSYNFNGNRDFPRTFCREEHHSSYYYVSHDHHPRPDSRPGSSDGLLSNRKAWTDTARQQPHEVHHVGLSDGSQELYNGMVQHLGGSTRGLFGYNPTEQISSILSSSNQFFSKLVPPNPLDMTSVLPLCEASRPPYLSSHSLDSHPSKFV